MTVQPSTPAASCQLLLLRMQQTRTSCQSTRVRTDSGEGSAVKTADKVRLIQMRLSKLITHVKLGESLTRESFGCARVMGCGLRVRQARVLSAQSVIAVAGRQQPSLHSQTRGPARTFGSYLLIIFSSKRSSSLKLHCIFQQSRGSDSSRKLHRHCDNEVVQSN